MSETLKMIRDAIEKLLSLLFDRRAQVSALVVAVLAFLPAFGFSPEDIDFIQETFDDTYAAALIGLPLLIKIIGVIMIFVRLINSWETRAPSGFLWKKLV